MFVIKAKGTLDAVAQPANAPQVQCNFSFERLNATILRPLLMRNQKPHRFDASKIVRAYTKITLREAMEVASGIKPDIQLPRRSFVFLLFLKVLIVGRGFWKNLFSNVTLITVFALSVFARIQTVTSPTLKCLFQLVSRDCWLSIALRKIFRSQSCLADRGSKRNYQWNEQLFYIEHLVFLNTVN